MRDHQAEYASLGIEAIPGGLAETYRYRDGEKISDPGARYRQPPNELRIEGLVAIALRWMTGTPRAR